MAIFRQFIAPLLIVLVFLVALLAVSARIFLPSDMATPAPIEEMETVDQNAQLPAVDAEDMAELPPSLETLVRGLPESELGTQL